MLNVRRVRIVATWSLISIFFLAPPSFAGDSRETSTPSLFSRVRGGFQGLVSADAGVLLGVGGGAALAMSRTENPVAIHRALDGSVFDGGVDVGDLYGSGVTIAAGSLGLMLAGELGRETAGEAGRDIFASFVVASATTWMIKPTMNRRRPLGGPFSFPSGHTAVAFSTLPAIYRHGGPWLGITATLLAVGTGAARMEDQRHYASDVFFGAALGLASGNAVMGEAIPWSGLWNRLTVSGKRIGILVRF